MTNIAQLGKLEKKIMDLVWEKQRCTVRDVYTELRKKRSIAYTTVMTVMTRLAAKGVLKRELNNLAYHYVCVETRESFLHKAARTVLNTFLVNFGEEAVVAFSEELQGLPKNKRTTLSNALLKKKHK